MPIIHVSYGIPKSAWIFTYVVTQTVRKTPGYGPPVALSDAVKAGESRLNYFGAISGSAI